MALRHVDILLKTELGGINMNKQSKMGYISIGLVMVTAIIFLSGYYTILSLGTTGTHPMLKGIQDLIYWMTS